MPKSDKQDFYGETVPRSVFEKLKGQITINCSQLPCDYFETININIESFPKEKCGKQSWLDGFPMGKTP